MTWRYVLQAERRMPPCPYCGSVGGTVRLKSDVFVCMDCVPRRAFEATWDDERTPLPVSDANLTPEARAELDQQLVGVGQQYRLGYRAGWVQAFVYRGETSAFLPRKDTP